MDRSQFIQSLEDAINVDPGTLGADSAFQSLEAWDSLGALAAIAMIDHAYGVTLSGSDIAGCSTVGDLISLVESRTEAKGG